MPNINLIATRRAEKKRVEHQTRQLFFGLTAEVAALVLLCSYIGARQLALRSALSETNREMIKLQPTLDRIDQIEKDTGQLKPKLETLVAAKADTLRWRAMLQYVSQSVPSNAWLSGLTSASSGEDTTITLAGSAGSESLVGRTMTTLSSRPVFDNVVLRYTQLSSTSADAVQRVSFEIGAHLKSTRPVGPTAPAAGPRGKEKANKQAKKGEGDGKSNA